MVKTLVLVPYLQLFLLPSPCPLKKDKIVSVFCSLFHYVICTGRSYFHYVLNFEQSQEMPEWCVAPAGHDCTQGRLSSPVVLLHISCGTVQSGHCSIAVSLGFLETAAI